jgi:hypothetical protein
LTFLWICLTAVSRKTNCRKLAVRNRCTSLFLYFLFLAFWVLGHCVRNSTNHTNMILYIAFFADWVYNAAIPGFQPACRTL